MGDTNLVGGIVKILETPKQKMLNSNIQITKFRVQFPQVRQTSLVHLSFWGNLAVDTANYYKINDYVLIEGYISVRDSKQFHNVTNVTSKSRKVEITVLKIYPFLLN
jgi:single-stranded DNA-binding protein